MNLDFILKNKSIQAKLLNMFTGMAKDNGMSKMFIDLSTGQPELTPVKDTDILVDAETHNFYKKFFEENKNLITDKK